MSTDLDTKARVVFDLLDKGAEEVSIVGTDIKVVRRAPEIPPTKLVEISKSFMWISNQALIHLSTSPLRSVSFDKKLSVILRRMRDTQKS